ncbi:type II secretion system protein [bacterium]|nr:type II secretion system protein [bacterium]
MEREKFVSECNELTNLREGEQKGITQENNPLPPLRATLSKERGLRKAAFTLAEVLITLGIIGVVAALTLPTLISNYQKKVYVTQLKKSYAVMSNGFKLMMGHDGVTELKDTYAFSGMLADKCTNGGGGTNNLLTDECRSIKEGLESVFSGIQFVPCNGKAAKELNGTYIGGTGGGLGRKSTYTCIQFPDGSEIIHLSAKKAGNNIGIFVDINGAKNPNTVGRDIFYLDVNNNGVITGSYNVTQNWRTATSSTDKCEMDGTSRGWGCAGRVLEEDAMNY